MFESILTSTILMGIGIFLGLLVGGQALNRVAEVTCGEGVENTYNGAAIYCMSDDGAFEKVAY